MSACHTHWQCCHLLPLVSEPQSFPPRSVQGLPIAALAPPPRACICLFRNCNNTLHRCLSLELKAQPLPRPVRGSLHLPIPSLPWSPNGPHPHPSLPTASRPHQAHPHLRAFVLAVPSAWKSLPDLHTTHSLASFRPLLKRHLPNEAIFSPLSKIEHSHTTPHQIASSLFLVLVLVFLHST